jgi:hypothetical protein
MMGKMVMIWDGRIGTGAKSEPVGVVYRMGS